VSIWKRAEQRSHQRVLPAQPGPAALRLGCDSDLPRSPARQRCSRVPAAGEGCSKPPDIPMPICSGTLLIPPLPRHPSSYPRPTTRPRPGGGRRRARLPADPYLPSAPPTPPPSAAHGVISHGFFGFVFPFLQPILSGGFVLQLLLPTAVPATAEPAPRRPQ